MESQDPFFQSFFEEFLEKQRASAIRMLRRLARRFGLNEDDAEDVWQEMLLKIWEDPERIRKLQEAVSGRARLFRWLRNSLIDLARCKGRTHLVELESIEWLLGVHGNQEDATIAAGQLKLLKQVAEDMPGRAGEALRLEIRSWEEKEEGADYEETGRRMGMKPGSAASHPARGGAKSAHVIGRR